MKKLILLSLLLSAGIGAIAQSANLTIINNSDWTVDATVYGYAPSSCSSGSCSTTYITRHIVLVPYGWPGAVRTYGPSDPCAVSVSPGFATTACSTPWCSALPSDFQWTFVSIDMYNYASGQPASSCWTLAPFPIVIGDAGIGCGGVSSSWGAYIGCPGLHRHLQAVWNTTGGSLADVTIEVDQF